MSNDEPMGCEVCSLPMTRVGDRHVHINTADQGHDPRPVAMSTIAVPRARCDFCNGEPVTTAVLSENFMMPQGGGRSVGDWAACAACGALVSRRQWNQLVNRVLISLPANLRGGTQKATLTETYSRLQLHMHGVMAIEDYRAGRR